jgi:hypothetical protein
VPGVAQPRGRVRVAEGLDQLLLGQVLGHVAPFVQRAPLDHRTPHAPPRTGPFRRPGRPAARRWRPGPARPDRRALTTVLSSVAPSHNPTGTFVPSAVMASAGWVGPDARTGVATAVDHSSQPDTSSVTAAMLARRCRFTEDPPHRPRQLPKKFRPPTVRACRERFRGANQGDTTNRGTAGERLPKHL